MLYPKTKALQPVLWIIHHIPKAAQSGPGVFVEAEESKLYYSLISENI